MSPVFYLSSDISVTWLVKGKRLRVKGLQKFWFISPKKANPIKNQQSSK